MKTYWIDECILTPEGKLLPRGFELHIGETARIVVPSDVPGDRESLYEEEIQLSQKTFAATYENGTPVHIEDGETIGEEKAIKRAEQTGCQVYVYGNFLPYLVEEGRNSYLDDSAPVNVIGEAKLLDIDEDRAIFEIEGEVTVQWLNGLRAVEHEEVFRYPEYPVTVIFRDNFDIDGLENLRCPECGAPLEQIDYDQTDQEFSIGCSANQDHHSFRIKAGTYRMLEDGDTSFVE